jgi:hypothetical protein
MACVVCGVVEWLRWRRRGELLELVCDEHARAVRVPEHVKLLGDPDAHDDPTARRFALLEID